MTAKLELSDEEMKQRLAEVEQKKTDSCAVEIQAILAKYARTLDVSVTLRAGQVLTQVNIIPAKPV